MQESEKNIEKTKINCAYKLPAKCPHQIAPIRDLWNSPYAMKKNSQRFCRQLKHTSNACIDYSARLSQCIVVTV